MRYAILSDIHANRQALQAVLMDIRSFGIDEIISLGDVVGYGPAPCEVLEKAYKTIHHFVLGNHDAVIADMLDPASFNAKARQIIEWTAQNLDSKAASFFQKHPLVIQDEQLILSHGEICQPGRFGYIMDEDEAKDTFICTAKQLIFVGHSHVPGLFVQGQSGVPHWLRPQDFTIEDEKRYIINPGSVGQPRDCDFRASYCILDTDQSSVEFRKVPFDIDAYRDDLKLRKLSEGASYFLAFADEKATGPVRDSLDFTPLDKSDIVKTSCDIQTLHRKVGQMRKIMYTLATCLILAVTATLLLAFNTLTQPTQPPAQDPFTRYHYTCTQKSLPCRGKKELIKPPAKTGKINSQNRLQSWDIVLSDPSQQYIHIIAKPATRQKQFQISSVQNIPFKLAHIPIQAKKGMKFKASAKVKKDKLKQIESLTIFLYFLPEKGEKIAIEFREVSTHKAFIKGDWAYIRFSNQKPLPGNGQLTYTIAGRLTGSILLKDCSLKLK